MATSFCRRCRAANLQRLFKQFTIAGLVVCFAGCTTPETSSRGSNSSDIPEVSGAVPANYIQQQESEEQASRLRKKSAEGGINKIHEHNAEQVKDAWYASIDAQLPRNIKVMRGADFDDTISGIRSGQVKVSGLKGLALDARNSAYRMTQVTNQFCVARHINSSYDLPLLSRKCPSDTIEGNPLGAVAMLWEIKGITYFTTVLGITQQALEVVPHNVEVPAEPDE